MFVRSNLFWQIESRCSYKVCSYPKNECNDYHTFRDSFSFVAC